MQPYLQHLRNLSRYSVMHGRCRMKRIFPEIFLQLDIALLSEVNLLGQIFILPAVISRVPVDGCLGVGFRVVHHLVEEGVRVEVEDCGIPMLVGQLRGEGVEALVPVCDRESRNRVTPLAGKGHAV